MAEQIAIEHLTKVYQGGNQALADVSIGVEAGTFLVLLGPSGSGKTTLLRCLAGIERITSGRIVIGDRTVADGRLHVPPDRRDASMVFQDYALWPHLCVRDNVAFALRRRRVGSGQARARADAMLERVGLGPHAERYPNELSGGEQQRVALARALIGDTGLVLCDEPLSNLDADLRERMRVEISSLVRDAGATTVYITHDQAEAFALADRIGVLQHGRLVQFGTPEEIYTAPASPFVARFTGLAGELAVRLAGPVRDGVAEVVAVAGQAGDVLGRGPAEPRARAFLVRAPAGYADDTGHGVVMIRPTGVTICGGEHDQHHLTGTVSDVAFRGRGYELAVDVPGHGRLTGIYARLRQERGHRVGLRLDQAGCLLYPAARPPEDRRPAVGGPSHAADEPPDARARRAGLPAAGIGRRVPQLARRSAKA